MRVKAICLVYFLELARLQRDKERWNEKGREGRKRKGEEEIWRKTERGKERVGENFFSDERKLEYVFHYVKDFKVYKPMFFMAVVFQNA